MSRAHVVSTARAFAVQAGRPQGLDAEAYALHLDEVAVLVRDFGDLHQTLAYLHDVLQDTQVSLVQVEEEFGPLVASCVGLLAELMGDDPKERRRLRYAELAKISAEDERAIALVVAAADRLAELQSCYLNEDRGGLRRYRRDHRDFRAAVMRPGLAEELWRELGALAIR